MSQYHLFLTIRIKAIKRKLHKKYGFLENSSRGVWSLTQLAKENKHIEPHMVVKEVREADKAAPKNKNKKTMKKSS